MTTEQAIRAVMDAHPDLTTCGVNGDCRELYGERRAALLHPLHVAEFERAVAWLVHVQKAKSGGHGSYSLKHVAEHWAGRYIANGPFIAAALHLGFRVKREDGDSPNALIGVASPRSWPLANDERHAWMRRRYRNKVVAIPPPFQSENKC